MSEIIIFIGFLAIVLFVFLKKYLNPLTYYLLLNGDKPKWNRQVEIRRSIFLLFSLWMMSVCAKDILGEYTKNITLIAAWILFSLVILFMIFLCSKMFDDYLIKRLSKKIVLKSNFNKSSSHQTQNISSATHNQIKTLFKELERHQIIDIHRNSFEDFEKVFQSNWSIENKPIYIDLDGTDLKILYSLLKEKINLKIKRKEFIESNRFCNKKGKYYEVKSVNNYTSDNPKFESVLKSIFSSL
jgi:hypothetical protein